MYALLLILHLLICLALIGVVLIQSGKGGGLAGGAFGGSAQTVFGGRGATDFVTRATMILGGGFFLTSLLLALLSTGLRTPTNSLIQNEARRAATAAPAQGQPAGGGMPGTAAPQGIPSAPQAAPSAPRPAPSPAGGGR